MISGSTGGLYSIDPYSTFTGTPTETNPGAATMGQAIGLPMPGGPTEGSGLRLVPAAAEGVTIIPRSLFITPTLPASWVNANDKSVSVDNRSEPFVKEQAQQIANKVNKNRVTIKTPAGEFYYDLRGAAHKGVPTPHLQKALFGEPNRTGKIWLNKDNDYVRPLTQQDIRTIMNFIKRLRDGK